jgi:outer membrane receptor protein involved in Fe transport
MDNLSFHPGGRVCRRLLLLTGFLLLGTFPPPAWCDTGQVIGRVIDPEGGPVVEAAVTIDGFHRTVITDTSGHFTIRDVPEGIREIRIRRLGFRETRIEGIHVPTGGTIDLGWISLRYRPLVTTGSVVTATRTDRLIEDVSSPVNVVEAEEMRERESKSSAEALREETGLFVQKTGHGGGSAIIRGLGSSQILLLVDGIRLNNSTFRLGNHPYLTTVDNQLVRRLEVIRGPTSVMHGSDALGGTINLITRGALDGDPTPGLDYRLFGRAATADGERTGRGEISLRGERIGVRAGLTVKRFDDLRRGGRSDDPEIEGATDGTVQRPSGFDAHDLDARIDWASDGERALTLAWQRSHRNEIPRYDKYENNDFHRWVYEPQERDLVYFMGETPTGLPGLGTMRILFSWQRQVEGRQIQAESLGELTRELDEVRTGGLSLQFENPIGSHRASGGFDLYLDDVRSRRSTEDPGTGAITFDSRGRFPDGADYRSLGFFLEDEWTPNNRWSFTTGLRYSLSGARFETLDGLDDPDETFRVDQSFRALTGSAGLVCRIDDHVHLITNVAQAFRAPNLSDIGKLGESKGETYEVPNANLEPERMLSGDGGLRVLLGPLRAEATVYISRITDLLASVESSWNGSTTIVQGSDTLKVKTKENIGSAVIRGLETSIDFRITRSISLSANVTATHGENTTIGEPVGGIPPTFGRVGLRWQGESAFADLFVRFADRQNRLSSDDLDDPRIPDSGTPGWSTWNIRASMPLGGAVDLQLSVENLLDSNYREHGSGINGPGRNFVVSVETSG